MTIFGKKLKKFVRAVLLSAAASSLGCVWISDQWNATPGPGENMPDNRFSRRTDQPASVNMAFGNPSNATTDAADPDNYLIVGDGPAFSYNNSRGTVNWISWKTTRADLGESIPRPDFRPDPRLPEGFLRVGPYDYSQSGYDRGHMVPSADRFGDEGLNEETFMMTNIVPQTGALNQHPWEKLESYSRRQSRRGFDVYTIAGVYGEQGTIKGKITVPTNCWKIIAFVPAGRRAEAIDDRTRIVAVDMPNREGIEKTRWEKFRTTVRAIEQQTGLDFFSTLPPAVQEQIETRQELSSIKP